MLATFSPILLYMQKTHLSSLDKSENLGSQVKFTLIRLHLLSAEGEYSGGMICCISYITTQISSRRIEDNNGEGKRRKANKELAFELTKHMHCFDEDSYQAVCAFLNSYIKFVLKRLKFSLL